LQSAALKQWEGNCGAGAGKFGTALEQIAETKGLESDESAKVDVGIESGARLSDALAGGFHPGTGGGDIGPAADQVDRGIGRDALRLKRGDRGTLDRQRAIGPGADQLGERMLFVGDGFVRGRKVGIGLRDPRLRLPKLGVAVETGSDPLLHQLQGLGTDVERALKIVALRVEGGEISISRSDSGSECKLRLIGLELGCLGVLSGGAQGSAVLAPEIEVERNPATDRAAAVPAARHG
jgi:hypothetical protein